jgi:hypothetical protein
MMPLWLLLALLLPVLPILPVAVSRPQACVLRWQDSFCLLRLQYDGHAPPYRRATSYVGSRTGFCTWHLACWNAWGIGHDAEPADLRLRREAPDELEPAIGEVCPPAAMIYHHRCAICGTNTLWAGASAGGPG